MTSPQIADLAARLERAWTSRTPIAPLTDGDELRDVEDAYATQQAWSRLRQAEGEEVKGRKIGLTSPGMQRQMGVDQPDFGELWASRWYRLDGGVADVPIGAFLQPRVEGEFAFLIAEDLVGPGVGEADVLNAASAAAPAIEIVDSRIEGWRIRLLDTIADNASFGGFAVGSWSEALLHADLAEVELRMLKNGDEAIREHGSAVLGSPFTAVAWLANTLGRLGGGIRAGDIVLSGSVGGAVDARGGDRFVVEVAGHGPVAMQFTSA